MDELVNQLEQTGLLRDKHIRQAFLNIDRADFVPNDIKSLAHIDKPFPIGGGQTISQPTVVAFMLELLQPKVGDKIMDVGAGSGWQTALLATLVGTRGKIYAVEVVARLCEIAQKNVAKYKFKNIKWFCLNARNGLPECAPFDGIIAGASGEDVPSAWKQQLKVGGRIVVPVGTSVFCYTKKDNDEFDIDEYPGFLFVPLIK